MPTDVPGAATVQNPSGAFQGTVTSGTEIDQTTLAPQASPAPPNGPAGGDLAGTYPNPSVNAVNGVVVSGTPSSGQVLTATSPTAAHWATPATPAPPAGALLGMTHYAPASAVVKSVSSTTLVAIDSTNLTVSFTTNASGPGSTSVLVKLSYVCDADANGSVVGMVTHGTTTQVGTASTSASGTATASTAVSATLLVTGLTPNTAYHWDMAAFTGSSGSHPVLVAGNPTATDGSGPVTIEVLAGLV